MTALGDLSEALAEIDDLTRAATLLDWDQETQMPAGGVEGRAQQVATLQRLAHERLISERVGELVGQAEQEVAGLDPDSDEQALVRVTRRDREQAVRIPASLVAEMARASSLAHPVWVEARRRKDWKAFASALGTAVDLARQSADALGWSETPYDALLGRAEDGLTTARLMTILEAIRTAAVPLVAVAAGDGTPAAALRRPLDESVQADFALEICTVLGYDLERGRQDISAHPFCVSMWPGDVRITTRTTPDGLPECLYSSIHETGHAIYYQGIPTRLARTPLDEGSTSGFHESQSRLWENLVGRSRAFAEWFAPRLRQRFPAEYGHVDAETWYRGVNVVERSLIRVDADEVTYNLHILLRAELEVALLEGDLLPADVPSAWNEKMQEYLGITPPDDAMGALQDVHWSSGYIGGFPSYALGNLIGAQLMEVARRDLGGLDDQIAAGDFTPLRTWLSDRVYSQGRKFTPDELLRRITGSPLSADAWIRYVREKFGA